MKSIWDLIYRNSIYPLEYQKKNLLLIIDVQILYYLLLGVIKQDH